MKRNLAIVFLTILFAFSQATAAQTTSLQQILRLTNTQSALKKMTFIEKRHLHFSSTPLITRGVLIFKKPDYLEKNITFPHPSRFIIFQQKLLIAEGHKVHPLNLPHDADLWIFTTTLLAVLNGDAHFLIAHYDYATGKQGRSWYLLLTPKKVALSRIRMMRIDGMGHKIKSINLQFTNGDWLQQQLGEDGVMQ